MGGSNMSEVASFSKIEIRAEGERIVTQGEPLESCWILLAGKAALSVWEDEETDFEGESSMSILENCMDQPLEACKILNESTFKENQFVDCVCTDMLYVNCLKLSTDMFLLLLLLFTYI